MNKSVRDFIANIRDKGLDCAINECTNWEEIKAEDPVLFNHIEVYSAASKVLIECLFKRYQLLKD